MAAAHNTKPQWRENSFLVSLVADSDVRKLTPQHSTIETVTLMIKFPSAFCRWCHTRPFRVGICIKMPCGTFYCGNRKCHKEDWWDSGQATECAQELRLNQQSTNPHRNIQVNLGYHLSHQVRYRVHGQGIVVRMRSLKSGMLTCAGAGPS